MFRDDFEFNDAAAPSHLGSTRRPTEPAKAEQAAQIVLPANAAMGAQWSPEATKELGKIPFFVRGKAKRNTERFATEQGVSTITVETLYDAKAHFSR
jgi:light-independent protochlorophyllide reductase subunit B